MPQAIPIIIAVIGLAVQIKGQADAKKQAKKQAALQRERNALEDQRRILQANAERDRLARETRTKKAAVANQAANQGAINTSSFAGGQVAIGTAGNRELNILNANDAINAQITQLGGATVGLNLETDITNSNNATAGAVLDTVSSITDTLGSGSQGPQPELPATPQLIDTSIGVPGGAPT